MTAGMIRGWTILGAALVASCGGGGPRDSAERGEAAGTTASEAGAAAASAGASGADGQQEQAGAGSAIAGSTAMGPSGGTGGDSSGQVCTELPPLWPDCDTVGQLEVDTVAPVDESDPPTELEQIDDPSQLGEPLRAAALSSLGTQFTEQWQANLQTYCAPRRVCTTPSTGTGGASVGGAMSAGGSTSVPSAGEDSSGSDERSGTNNQVEGVDEPDLMKLDDRYVYVVASNDLLVLDAEDPTQTVEMARTSLEGTPTSILLAGDRLLVIASLGTSIKPRCTYAYSCQFGGDGTRTVLTTFDVTDRSAPKAIRRIELSGSFLAGRMIDGVVHAITVESSGILAPGVSSVPYVGNLPSAKDALTRYQQEYDAEEQRLQGLNLQASLPTISDKFLSDDGTMNGSGPGDPTRVMHGSPSAPTGIVTVTSFDLAAEERTHQDAIFSDPGAVYVSLENLYLAVPEVGRNYSGYGVDSSWIHDFELSGAGATYVASGRVTGHVLNQFSLDEYEGNLRIATSTGYVPDPNVKSTVTVLARSGPLLRVQGQVDQIAPGEDIRAVRFFGDRGYVVTFKKTDPLFVLDLSQPTEPTIEGELKIPGFSTYLHPLDENHLLSIGYDADDMGSFAYFDGITLQIMDVADPNQPTLLFRETIGTRGSSSEALTDHLAFNYFASRRLLAIPMTICEGGNNGVYGDVLTFTGLLVYDVDLENGFSLRGRVPHPAPEGFYASAYQTTCSTWWTNASSPVKRSAFVGDTVFSLGEALLKVNNLDDLDQELARFPVGPLPCSAQQDAASCNAQPGCYAIEGTDFETDQPSYVGCMTLAPGVSAPTCTMSPTCIVNLATSACATLPHTCVPDGWVTLASGACSAELCAP